MYLIFSAEEWAGAVKISGSAHFDRIQLGFCPRSTLPVILLFILGNRLGVSAAVSANVVYICGQVSPVCPALVVPTVFFALRVCL